MRTEASFGLAKAQNQTTKQAQGGSSRPGQELATQPNRPNVSAPRKWACRLPLLNTNSQNRNFIWVSSEEYRDIENFQSLRRRDRWMYKVAAGQVSMLSAQEHLWQLLPCRIRCYNYLYSRLWKAIRWFIVKEKYYWLIEKIYLIRQVNEFFLYLFILTREMYVCWVDQDHCPNSLKYVQFRFDCSVELKVRPYPASSPLRPWRDFFSLLIFYMRIKWCRLWVANWWCGGPGSGNCEVDMISASNMPSPAVHLRADLFF